jgi:predicted RNA-binding protein YlqC (UPF0109 family)
MALDYREMFDQVKAEIASKRKELGVRLLEVEAMEDQIIGLQQTAAGLAKTLGEQYIAEDELGLTDAIRRAFKQNYLRDFTALEIKPELESMGHDLGRYGNAMASIHSVIKRIQDKDIKQTGSRGGKPCYRWIQKSSK